MIYFKCALIRISLFILFLQIFSHFINGTPDPLKNTPILKILQMVKLIIRWYLQSYRAMSSKYADKPRQCHFI